MSVHLTFLTNCLHLLNFFDVVDQKSEEVTDSMLKFISSHFQGKGCVTTKDSGPRLAGVSNKR